MYMPFGKHRGRPLEDVPHTYLLWVLDNCTNISGTLRAEIERVLDVGPRQRQEPDRHNGHQTGALAVDTVSAWYRRLAMEFHPDHRGNHEGMKAINRARDVLLEMVGNQG